MKTGGARLTRVACRKYFSSNYKEMNTVINNILQPNFIFGHDVTHSKLYQISKNLEYDLHIGLNITNVISTFT